MRRCTQRSIVTRSTSIPRSASILRVLEGKQQVELHDYVDVRIPILDRMHAKRLPAYATLGFDVPRTRRPRTRAESF